MNANLANDLINDPETIISDPDFQVMVSEEFANMPSGLQEFLYNSLRDKYILPPIETFRKSADIQNATKPENIEILLEKVANNYINNQIILDSDSPSGYWKLLKLEQAVNFNKHLETVISNAYNGEGDVENAWSNCMVALFLMKWKKYLESHNGTSSDILKLNNIINNVVNWIVKVAEPNNDGGLWGVGSLPPKAGKVNSVYDSSLAVITLAYDRDIMSKKRSPLVNLFTSIVEYGILNGHESSNNIPDEKDFNDVGAASYFVVSAIKCIEHDLKVTQQTQLEPYMDVILNSQNRHDGGWGQYSGTPSRIDTTCYALMALAKIRKMTPKKIYDFKIRDGIDYISEQANKVKEREKNCCWVSDEDNYKTCLKTSSLAISTLLRCGVEHYNHLIKLGIEGTYKLWREDFGNQVDRAYFHCMLIDYLRLASSNS